MTEREKDRRLILKGLLGTGFAALGWIVLDVWLAAGRFSPSHWTAVAPLEQLPTEGTYPFPEFRVALLRQGDKVAALSLECTHLGCLVNTVDQGFYCPCHGSQFGPRGEVWSGPATRSLPWHLVRVQSGKLWMHTGRKSDRPGWVNLGTGDGSAT